MHELWRLFVYDAMPLIAVVVAVVGAVRVFWVLGLRSDPIEEILARQRQGTRLRSMLAGLRGIRAKVPESGLAQLGSIGDPNREEVLKVLGTAEGQFRDRIRPLEVWTSVSAYLTGILLFITVVYAASALRSLMVGLSLEIQHSTNAILDVIQNIVVVVFRSAWVVFCLFVLNTVVKFRVTRRKERWATFANRLTREVAEG
jgi:hypothetical protein